MMAATATLLPGQLDIRTWQDIVDNLTGDGGIVTSIVAAGGWTLPDATPETDPHRLAVARVMDAIDSDPGAPTSVDAMAAIGSYSKFYFTRLFVEYTSKLRPPMLAAYGMSPAEYVMTVRIELAKRLLMHTDMTITEITLAVGYTAIGTFSSRFTSHVGQSPTEFRRGLRQELWAATSLSDDGRRLDVFDRHSRSPRRVWLGYGELLPVEETWAIYIEGASPDVRYPSRGLAKKALKAYARNLLEAQDQDAS